MKIKTITCHDIYNYGAALQAYALQAHLVGLGHEVEIIDYKPDYNSWRLNPLNLYPKWSDKPAPLKLAYLCAKAPFRYLKHTGTCKKPFDDFRREFLRVTKERYLENADLVRNPPEAEVYVAGSDQIWNTTYPTGRDASFYLNFAPEGTRRVSYAASVSTRSIEEESVDFFKDSVRRFDHVSVREAHSVRLLDELGLAGGQHVMDPVFLLGSEEWNAIASPPRKERYLAVYDMEGKPMIEEFVQSIAKKRGLKIYGINNYSRTPYADRDFYNRGPRDFLSLIRDAELFVGNSFHGLAFSILFNKEFFAFRRMNPGHEGTSFRMEDLMATLGIPGRLLGPERVDPEAVRKIDYARVNSMLAEKVAASKAFLAAAVRPSA